MINEIKIDKIEVDGIVTWIRRLNNVQENKYKLPICPKCRKKINSGDDTFLLINNYKLFPNCFIHTNCATPNWELLIKLLREDYQKAEINRAYNFCWYKNEK